mmetsp:Transcript_18203/g.29445  ORF Transcript_18203/g.29445 Transcript_18203/m.29445 type:complete len:149 (+) Transcript_18203:241-687(+)
MVDVKSKMCEQAGCGKGPCFNFKGEERGIFCLQHKVEGMVDVRSKRCEQAGCSNMYYYKGGRFCTQHKLQDMDARSKKCEHARCSKQATFNFEGEKGNRFCANHANHALPGMMNKRQAQRRKNEKRKRRAPAAAAADRAGGERQRASA